jgi:hypothetical protein
VVSGAILNLQGMASPPGIDGLQTPISRWIAA